ncbi:MAG: hypothetical protein ACTHJN_19700 [Ginsengibacter sp.]
MKQIVLLLTLSFTFSIINAQTTQRKEIKSSAGVSLLLPFLSNAISYDYAAETNTSQTGYLGGGMAVFFQKNKNKYSISYEHPSIKKNLVAQKGATSPIQVNITEFTLEHTFKKSLALITGLNYSVYSYHFHSDAMPTWKIDTTDKTIGLNMGLEYITGKSTAFGVCYKPALFSFGKKSYRHLISLFSNMIFEFGKSRFV